MNDFNYENSPDVIDTPKNKFPIVPQLIILLLVMITLFGSLIFGGFNKEKPVQTPTTQNIKTDDRAYPITPQKIEDVSIRAESAYVWDVKGQRVLYAKNSTEPLPLASITKLMTALLAYELISQDQTTSVSLSAILQEGSSGLAVGETFVIDDLTSLALISSSNDAAYALAASVGQALGDNDPISQFVTGMNIRAEELGLDSMQFQNMTGLDINETEPGSIGNAKDVTFLMEYIINNYPEIVSPTQQQVARVYNSEGFYHDAKNTNEIVVDIPNLIGSKTGYTDLAGGNLTVAFDAGFDRPIIITVLGSTRDERFTDMLTLINAVQNSLSN